MWGFLCVCVGGRDQEERLKFDRHVLYINEFAVEN